MEHRTTPSRTETATTDRASDPVGSRIARAVRNGLIGAVPGIVVVLLAQFAIDGEMQLTVGAPGILLAVAGATLGLVHGFLSRHR